MFRARARVCEPEAVAEGEQKSREGVNSAARGPNNIFCPHLNEVPPIDDIQHCTPPELREAAAAARDVNLPDKSRAEYEKAYEKFVAWQKMKKVPDGYVSENVMLAYFTDPKRMLRAKYPMVNLVDVEGGHPAAAPETSANMRRLHVINVYMAAPITHPTAPAPAATGKDV